MRNLWSGTQEFSQPKVRCVMKKNVFDEGFYESFINYVKELQRLDSRSTRQPLYREKLDFVFGVMSERFLSRLYAQEKSAVKIVPQIPRNHMTSAFIVSSSNGIFSRAKVVMSDLSATLLRH